MKVFWFGVFVAMYFLSLVNFIFLFVIGGYLYGFIWCLMCGVSSYLAYEQIKP